jgi:hypothetical protein
MSTQIKQQTDTKKKQLKKMLLVGVGLTATGVAGYFGWQYYKKQKGAKGKTTTFSPPADPIPEYQPTSPSYTPTDTPPSTPSYTPPKTNPTSKPTYTPSYEITPSSDYGNYNSTPKTTSAFPLKRGSKGDKVRRLQQALVAQHGSSILPRYGADGDFGSELANALTKLKYPTRISESLFNVITSSKGANTNSLAKQILGALNIHDFPKTISLLKQIGSVEEYTTVSAEFKNYRVNGGVRQTLVNGALNAFIDTKQKQSVRMEFLRIGLKFDGSKWTLSGLDGYGNSQIITTRPTKIWLDGINSKPVPARMVLGTPISQRLDYTLFENSGQHFVVATNDIKIY